MTGCINGCLLSHIFNLIEYNELRLLIECLCDEIIEKLLSSVYIKNVSKALKRTFILTKNIQLCTYIVIKLPTYCELLYKQKGNKFKRVYYLKLNSVTIPIHSTESYNLL